MDQQQCKKGDEMNGLNQVGNGVGENAFGRIKRFKKQAGVTLIEALIVLTVGTALIGGAFVAARSANEDQQAQQDAREVATLVQNIRKVYGGIGYTGMTSTAVQTAGALPEGVRTNGANAFITSSNMPVAFTTAAAPGLTYTILFGNANTPIASCMAVAKAIAATALVVTVGSDATAGTAGGAPGGATAYKASASAQTSGANLLAGCNATGSMVGAQFR